MPSPAPGTVLLGLFMWIKRFILSSSEIQCTWPPRWTQNLLVFLCPFLETVPYGGYFQNSFCLTSSISLGHAYLPLAILSIIKSQIKPVLFYSWPQTLNSGCSLSLKNINWASPIFPALSYQWAGWTKVLILRAKIPQGWGNEEINFEPINEKLMK